MSTVPESGRAAIALLQQLDGLLQQLQRNGRLPEDAALVLPGPLDDELVGPVERLNLLVRWLQQATRLGRTLADGDLQVSLPRDNPLLMPLKALQANLQHLSWQACRVAEGDLNQRVHFLGDFSTAFNAMIAALQRNRAIEEQLKTLTEVLGEGVCLVDAAGGLTFANPEAAKLLGLGQERLSAPTAPTWTGRKLLNFFAAAPATAAAAELRRALEAGYDFHSQDLLLQPAGGVPERPVALVCRPIWQEGQYQGAVLAFHDISAQKGYEKQLETLNRQLQKQATTDALTGLANRMQTERLLQKEMERADRYQHPLTVILLDLDHFKQINDQFGHAAGDIVLRTAGALLRDNLRDSDSAGRWGGEEFLLLLPQTGALAACRVAEKLRLALQQTDFALPRPVTASFGVAELQPAEDGARLTARADDALYRAKDGGRNRVELAGRES